MAPLNGKGAYFPTVSYRFFRYFDHLTYLVLLYKHQWNIPGELSRVNISSHSENNMLFSQMKRFPLLWLNNPLDLLLYDRNITGSSSEIFSDVRKSSVIFEKCSERFIWSSDNFLGIFGNLRKMVKNVVTSIFI